MPELYSRKVLHGLQGWIANTQSVIDYDVGPGSEVSDSPTLSFEIGKALSGVSEAVQ